MFGNKPMIEVLATHVIKSGVVHGESLLFCLYNGEGRLKHTYYQVSGEITPYEMSYYGLTLNDVPLVYSHSSGSPTTESLLAAGYGLPVDSEEIGQVCDNLTGCYAGLTDGLKRLEPIIGLLQNGAYTLTASGYFPTDGEGRFFWDVPNDFTAFPATAEIYDSVNYRSLTTCPCYLYPSQPTAQYDPERVAYYRAKLKAGESIPYGLSCAIGSGISILLDGHHRACACALEGVQLPCLTISPACYSLNAEGGIYAIYWPDGKRWLAPDLTDKQLKCLRGFIWGDLVDRKYPPKIGDIFNYSWPTAYQEAVASFPTYEEAIALALYPESVLCPDGLHDLANCTENDETQAAATLLGYLARQKDTDKKTLALYFTLVGYDTQLRLEAFRMLDKIKNDPEVEDFFVDYLINHNDRTDPLWKIADNYWS